jgi:CubicO group peptidase (beta-lactamase class C family)
MKKFYIILCLFSVINLSYGQDGSPWQVSSPEEQGMSSLTYINGIDQLINDSINIHSLVIINNDHLVLDAYFYPFQKNYVHDLASVTKSITSLLIGIAIDKGFIASEDEFVVNYFPEYSIKNDTFKTLKLKDLLNMVSGLQCSWDDGEKELKQMNKSEDWIEFMFNLPFKTKPGEQFSYCSGNFYLLAEILQRATKMTCHNFAKKYFFRPLNFDETYWLKNHNNVNIGWGDLFMTTYDMAKIGNLILNNGKWNGKQVISKEWIDKIKPLYRINDTEYYGYGWWHDNKNPNEIQAIGRGGQRLFVLKAKQIVIATTGGGFDAGDLDDLVFESIKSYNNKEDYNDQLIDKINSLKFPPLKSTNEESLPISILNKSYQFETNDIGITQLQFEQRKKDYYIILEFIDGSTEIHPIGLNNEYKISNERVLSLPIGIKGSWNNNKLVIYYNEFSRINLYKFTFAFSDNSINFDFQDLTNHWNVLLNGTIKK